jgi:phosphoserine phosphatase RsbU/P
MSSTWPEKIESAILAERANTDDIYENAPCGHVSTLPDGTVIRINATLLGWLGYTGEHVIGRRRFTDLLTVGGRIHHETHFAPLLQMQGAVGGMALDMRRADGGRLAVLASSTVVPGQPGVPTLVRTVIFEATDRRTYERELLRTREDAERDRDRVQRLATVLQRSLLPPRLPDVPGIETAAYYHPASLDEVGGDFYDLFPLEDGRWGFFLGDVCGKGADAAALTSLARYTLRSAAAYDPNPVTVLHTLNSVLIREGQLEGPTFCSVIHGLLSTGPDRCTLTLAGGGHPPALLLRAGGTAEFLSLKGGQLAGAVADAHFSDTTVELHPGDTLLLYTDGLIEARIDARRTRYDEDRLLAFAAALAPASASEIIEATVGLLDGFGDGLDDDIALLALGLPIPSCPSRSGCCTTSGPPGPHREADG